MLVESGVPVGKKYPDYINRLKVTSEMIQVLNVNVSDLGRYELTDYKGRLVSNNTMVLVGKKRLSSVYFKFVHTHTHTHFLLLRFKWGHCIDFHSFAICS